jgi:hypothetical protein
MIALLSKPKLTELPLPNSKVNGDGTLYRQASKATPVDVTSFTQVPNNCALAKRFVVVV